MKAPKYLNEQAYAIKEQIYDQLDVQWYLEATTDGVLFALRKAVDGGAVTEPLVFASVFDISVSF